VADSWDGFWERLVVDAVAVVVLAFTVQGLWFGLADLLVRWNVAEKSSLVAASARLGYVWVATIVAGLALSVWRALAARKSPRRSPAASKPS
jgi:hypothetical protein